MSRLVAEAKRDYRIRHVALQLVANLAQKDYTGEVRALFNFVKNHIRYVRDIRGIETLQIPLKTLEIKQGDCDDKSTLLAALLETIGHPTRFVAIGMTPDEYSHVYVETKIGSKWIPLETTEPWNIGDRARHVIKMMRHN